MTGDAARPALRAEQLTSGGVIASFELKRSARISDAEQLTELRRGRAILRHLGLQIRAHAVLTGEHLGEPFGTQLAADAGQGRRIATGIAEIVVTLEIGLTRGVGSAESVAFMAGDAVERL